MRQKVASPGSISTKHAQKTNWGGLSNYLFDVAYNLYWALNEKHHLVL